MLEPAVATVRRNVRRLLAEVVAPGELVLVACSGGADSLALAAATAFEAPKMGLRAGSVTIDHGIQADSAAQTATAREQAKRLGLRPVISRRVHVEGGGGPEAAARNARYGALDDIARENAARWVLLGHTRDDQAETVLLGLGRGSGPRSIAGMRSVDKQWLRPLLDVPRTTTVAACRAQHLETWHDPHNVDPQFRRVRLRHEVLPLLEDVLGGGVAAALARTATQLRGELDALDMWESILVRDRLAPAMADRTVDIGVFDELPPTIRRRLLRVWLRGEGVPNLSSVHLHALDALLTEWTGQGPVGLPGGFWVTRRDGKLSLVKGAA